jgi:hypothetical protein
MGTDPSLALGKRHGLARGLNLAIGTCAGAEVRKGAAHNFALTNTYMATPTAYLLVVLTWMSAMFVPSELCCSCAH